MIDAPQRGEVWRVDLSPVRGHEQSESRPAVVVSADRYNRGAAGLVIVAPMTRTDRGIPLHVRVEPPEGGLRSASFVMCDQIRCVSKDRLAERWGRLSAALLEEIEDRLRIVLAL